MTNKSDCIILLSLPCSGSALLAGVFQKLGITFDCSESSDLYIDPRWEALNIRAKNDEEGWEDECREIVRRYSSNRFWGINDPNSCFTFDKIFPIIEEMGVEVKVVVVVRNSEVIKQLSGLDNIEDMQLSIGKHIGSFSGAILLEELESIIARPIREINRIFHALTGRFPDQELLKNLVNWF